MQYIHVSDTNWVEYDEDKKTSRVINVTQMQAQLDAAQLRLQEIPEPLTDEELLAWARANYPAMDYSKERAELEKQISEAQATLEAINGL